MISLRLVVVNLLSDLEVALCYEIQSVDFAEPFAIDFLATHEVNFLHILDDFFDDVGSQIGKDPEASEEGYNLLKLTLFFLPDGPDVILSMQGSKASRHWALDRCSPTIVLKKSKLSKTATVLQSSDLFEPIDSHGFASEWIGKLKDVLMDGSLILQYDAVKARQSFCLIKVDLVIGRYDI